MSAQQAALTSEQVPQLKLKWAFAYPKAQRARSQPSIGWGAVFVGSQDGTVYAFDLKSGWMRWSVRASAELRTAIVADPATWPLFTSDTPDARKRGEEWWWGVGGG